jgi:hypothetical protein
MGDKPITANEMGRRGGTSRPTRYSRAQIRVWGKLVSGPRKLGKAVLTRLDTCCGRYPKAEIATRLEMSTRTMTRYVSRIMNRAKLALTLQRRSEWR